MNGIVVQRKSPGFLLRTLVPLVAVIGWALLTRPYIVETRWVSEVPEGTTILEFPDEMSAEQGMVARAFELKHGGAVSVPGREPNSRLKWPGLALLALVAWEVAWRRIDRRRAQGGETPS